MGFNDYGTTPNVWRPSDVPGVNSGEDTGVGQMPAGTGLGQEVTETTTTETNSPFVPGWNQVADFRTRGTASTAGEVVGTLALPLNFGIYQWTIYFKTFSGVGTAGATFIPRISVAWPSSASYQPEIAGIQVNIPVAPGTFARHFITFRASFNGNLAAPSKGVISLSQTHWGYSQCDNGGTPTTTAGSTNPSQTGAITSAQWNGNGAGIDDIASLAETVLLSCSLRLTVSGTITQSPFIMGGIFTAAYPAPGTLEEFNPRWIVMGM